MLSTYKSFPDLFRPPLVMADCSAVLHRISQLPCELRLLIRSYVYFADFNRLEAL